MPPSDSIEETTSKPEGKDPDRISIQVHDLYPSLFDLYTHLHANPELSGQELQTSRCIAGQLRAAGLQVTEGVGGHGIVSVLENGEGPTVLLRADLDGLPVEEKTGLPYASMARGLLAGKGEVGLMHACGHDVHMTVLVGAARILVKNMDLWQGTLVLVGQPLEEVGAGARAMIEDGLFTRFPRPDFALALHVTPSLAAGSVGLREGLFWAGCASLDIIIRGIGGHGSRPHETKDPIVMAAETVLLLQTIVSREISPIEPAVLSVGSIHGGTKGNIIPEEVVLQLNYRYFSDATARHLRSAIERTTRGVAIASGIPEERMPILIDQYSGPPITNDPELARRMFSAFRRALGNEHVIHTERYTFSDDFSQFGMHEPGIPLCYFLLGTAGNVCDAEETVIDAASPGIHNPSFAPLPEPSIKTGVKAMVAAILEILPR
ncbi:MAG: amidohydrolase [Geobacteraceae bacterium]|nr:amidohydrolase [Geobacteraceae bacterium]